jgi:hypothetical protein
MTLNSKTQSKRHLFQTQDNKCLNWPLEILAPFICCPSAFGPPIGVIGSGVCLSVCPGPSNGTSHAGAVVGASVNMENIQLGHMIITTQYGGWFVPHHIFMFMSGVPCKVKDENTTMWELLYFCVFPPRALLSEITTKWWLYCIIVLLPGALHNLLTINWWLCCIYISFVSRPCEAKIRHGTNQPI